MALTKIKTKDLARSASLQRSRRRRRSIVFLSTASNSSRFFDERIGRHPGSSSSSKSTTNKHPLSTTMAEPPVSPKTDATKSPYISSSSSAAAPQQSHHPKSPNQHSKPPAKKTRPEISLIKKKEQEASSETSESSSSSARPPSIFDRDEVRGESGPVVDTPPSSPASESATESERKRVATKKERRERKRASLLQQRQQQDTTSSEKQNPTKQEKREAKKQSSAQQEQQQSTTSTPDSKLKTKVPVEQAKSKKESAKPQVSSAQKDATKPNRTAGQSRTGKKTEMGDERARRRQFLDSLDRRWPNPNVGGYGLFNPGVFCYRRSVLQCLLNIPVFVTWLSTHRRHHSNHCPGQIQESVNSEPRIRKATACFACALIGLAEAYWTPKSKQELLDATRYFDLTMKKIAFSTSRFPMGADPKGDFKNQQDANEFCLWMLNILPSHNQMDDFQYKSIFEFGMNKAWACTKCERVSRSSANDMHMSVSIQAGQRNRLETCIEQQLLHDKLEGVYCDNKRCSYYSKLEKGKKPEEGMTVNRRTAFTQLPEIMIIHLRRFASRTVWKGKRAVTKNIKIDDPVMYPPVLDLSKYLAPGFEDEKARYSLSGVVLQWGELSFGHYLARTVTPKGVRQISDSNVQSINFSDLLQPHDKRNRDSTPYVLFYTRLRDGDAIPLAEDGASKPKPTGSGSKTSSAKNSKPNTSKSKTVQPSNSSFLKRSDAGFQKKRKFSDAQPSPGFKKHKQNNHRSNRI